MRKLFKRSGIAAACALGLAITAPAVADSVGDAKGPGPARVPDTVIAPDMVIRPGAADSFTLVVRPHGQGARSVALNCRPVGGNHPAAREACAQLRSARGEIAALPPADALCTLEQSPVTVVARGLWHAQPRSYRRTFSNHCVAVRETGGVLFDF